MTLKDLVGRNLCYRRFDGKVRIDSRTLQDILNLARKAPSLGNLQPLKYFLVNDEPGLEDVFRNVGWSDPCGSEIEASPPEERPSAYVVIFIDENVVGEAGIDVGAAAQTILLGAVEKELGGILVATAKWDRIRDVFGFPENLRGRAIVALGVPSEEVVVDDLEPGGSVKCWKDPLGVRHCPKRRLEELVLKAGPAKGTGGKEEEIC